MNVIDNIIIGILAISVVYGLYHGFLQSVFSVAAGLLSLGAAFMFGPRLANALLVQPQVTNTLASYTDAIARVGDFDLASTRVQGLSANVVDTVIKSVSLPEPIAGILRDNLTGEVFSGAGLSTVNDYVSSTIVTVALQVMCFLAVFLAAYLLLTFVLNLLRSVTRFPILKQLDWLAGGVLGLVRGAVICYLILLLVPLIQTIVPDEGLDTLLAGSLLAPKFSSITMFLRVVKGG